MSLKEYNKDVEQENHNQLRTLEEFYTTGKVNDMMKTIEEKKKEIVNDMIAYKESRKVPTEFDEEGNVISYEYNRTYNPLVISNYFFKPITPISCQEPEYNAEKLGMVFDYYCYLVAEVNEKICDFPSSLTSFCKLAGITLSTLRRYKNSNDLNMRVIAEKIYDQIGDENVTLSQLGIVKERTTLFKMKSQNELVEKQQPNVHINITEKPDLEKIEARLNKYKQFADKKRK